jgi:hypothetical protein
MNSQDSDSWIRQWRDDEDTRVREAKKKAIESKEREEQEARRWYLGLSGGYGTAEGGHNFRANYVGINLQVMRYSEVLGASSNGYIGIELPVRRYSDSQDKETAWSTGMFVLFGLRRILVRGRSGIWCWTNAGWKDGSIWRPSEDRNTRLANGIGGRSSWLVRG